MVAVLDERAAPQLYRKVWDTGNLSFLLSVVFYFCAKVEAVENFAILPVEGEQL